jgi:hypothetical protein
MIEGGGPPLVIWRRRRLVNRPKLEEMIVVSWHK